MPGSTYVSVSIQLQPAETTIQDLMQKEFTIRSRLLRKLGGGVEDGAVVRSLRTDSEHLRTTREAFAIYLPNRKTDDQEAATGAMGLLSPRKWNSVHNFNGVLRERETNAGEVQD